MKSYAYSALIAPILLLLLAFTTLTTTPAYGEVRITSYGSAPIPNGNLYSSNHEALQRALLDSIQKFFNARPDIDQPKEITKDFNIFINSYSILNRSISETNTRVIYVTRVYLDDEALTQWNNIIGLTKVYSTVWLDLYINGNRETTSIYEGVGQLLASKLKQAQYYSANKQQEIDASVDIVNDEGYDQAYEAYNNDDEISRLVYTSINLQYDDITMECSIATDVSATYKIGKPTKQGEEPTVATFESSSLDDCINGQLPSIVSDLSTLIASEYYTNNNIHSFQLIIENMKDMVYINNMLMHLANRRYITNSSLQSLSTTNITYTLSTTFDISQLSTKLTQYIKTTTVLPPATPQSITPETELDATENTLADIAESNDEQNAQLNNAKQPDPVAKTYNVEMRRTPTYIRLIF